VITEPVLVDAGPLVALLHKRDAHHEKCVEQSRQLAQTMLTCWPVLTEAAWLLRGVRPLLQMIESGKLVCLDLDGKAAGKIHRTAEKYSSLRPQLADLALVYLAEREKIDRIFTLDRRDFSVYRQVNGKPFQLLPEER
jgi:uncharacterized protein